jgi:hypothetical protein
MEFRLLMLSAMYENGGNTVHRFLDGHPEMFVYPFESQLGTNFGHDHLTSMFSVKYRWRNSVWKLRLCRTTEPL